MFVYPLALDDSEESDFESLVVPAWRSRPYTQPLLIEELMRNSLSLPRHVNIDKIVQDISHGGSMLDVLDAAELSHD